MNSAQIAQLCATYGLGAPVAAPQAVPGGLLHHVWRLRTARGDFAVKELNPEIARRPGIREVFRRTERIAAAMAAAGVPAVAALDAEGEPARDVDGATALVYPWVEGETLLPVTASPARARRIGAVLARMHALRLEAPDAQAQAPLWALTRDDDWLLLARRAAGAGVAWADEVRAALPEIAAWNATYRQALPVLFRTLVISHRDLDPKNVLWRDGQTPLIVDWESAGPINPAVELAGVALNWSGHETGLPNAATLAAALDGYRGAGGSVQEAGRDALAGCLGSWLDWLQFSMRRSMGEQGAGPDERDLGVRETVASLAALRTLAANLETWGHWIDGQAAAAE
jgi:Ser/Thr protein kinase RdoA (MazF antagonist)